MERQSFVVADADAGKRLDVFLVERLEGVSRARVQELIAQDKLRVDGKPAKPSLRLRGAEVIEVLGPAVRPPLRAVPEDIPLDVVYEDADVAVVNKPAGMQVHAGAGKADSHQNRGTLVNALLHRFARLSKTGGGLRPGIVHRLDKQTSGLILVAKSDRAHQELARQFAARKVRKTYVALVHGWVKADSGTIRSPIGRDPVRRTRMTTHARGGREAITHYRVRERFASRRGKFSLLEVKIDTGRTHQIRVHVASLGHPIVGDTLYGAPNVASTKAQKVSRQREHLAGGVPLSKAEAVWLSRNFLHAAAIEFEQPRTGNKIALKAPLPEELRSFLVLLKRDGRAGMKL